MKIPQITIHQQFAQIGLKIQPAIQQIKTENSQVNVQSEPSQVSIKYKNPDIKVDWQPVRDDLGFKKPNTLAKEIRNNGQQKTYEMIGQMARDGDRLGNIASGERNVAGNLAKEKFFRDAEVETTLRAIPTKGPSYDVSVYPPKIEMHQGTVKVNPNDIAPVIDYKVGDVEGYLLQKPRVDISI